MEKDCLYILDSYGLIYREYYAFISHPLTNSKGENVSAVFGFFRNLADSLKRYGPKYFVAAFDSRTPTFRHEMYKEYKATRQKTPDELIAQFPIIEKGLELLGIKVVRCDGFEADDVIATLAADATKRGQPCKIFSADKDLMQLVNDTTHLLKPDKDKIWADIGIEGVKVEWGVEPEKMLDLLSLTGDSADNVPGVQGVGVKTGVKLLSEYGTLEGIYENADKIKGALGEKIRGDKENAFFSKKLIELRYDVPCERDLGAFSFGSGDFKEAIEFFKEIGVPKIAKMYEELSGGTATRSLNSQRAEREVSRGLSKGPAHTAKPAPASTVEQTDDFPVKPAIPIRKISGEYKKIETIEELKTFLSAPATFAFSFWETGIAISKEKGKAVYIDFGKSSDNGNDLFGGDLFGNGNDGAISKQDALSAIKIVFENKENLIVAHDLKAFFKFLADTDTEVSTSGTRSFERALEVPVSSMVSRASTTEAPIESKLFDTMIAAWLLDPNKTFAESYELSFLAEKNLALLFSDEDEDEIETRYCQIADATIQVYPAIREKLEKRYLIDIFENMEMKVLPILAKMENAGIHIDSSILENYKVELSRNIAQSEKEIFSKVGHEFNIASPKQLGEVLFEEMGLKSSKKTKTGYSTDSEVLEELAKENDVARLVLDFRSNTKLLSTYVEPLVSVADKNGRIHTTFVQTGTATGRLSSKEPNLQNIPVREEEGRRIRSAFVAENGKVLISADYAQIELVVLAHLSEDKNLCSAFNSGIDVHKDTASKIYGIAPDEVTSQMRRNAKTINFGVMYGMGAFSLAKDLGIPFAEAQRFIADYFKLYSGVKNLIDETIEHAEEKGFVKTMFGRSRRIQNIKSSNHREKEEAHRIATNTPIQGTAADIVKKAMIDVDEALRKNPTGAKLLLQVHDELIFECPDEKDAIEKTISIIKDKMENAVKLKVPLRVSIESGKSWGDFH